MAIEMKAVKSSNIESLGYDEATKTLAVKFKSGGTYHYSDITADQHTAFSGAKSIGAHFHENFRKLKGVKQK